ncbi:MAG TPA: hypothetical protein VIY49_00715 [Bryobacteraceae bacterium]
MWENDNEETEAAVDASGNSNATRNGRAGTLPHMRRLVRRSRREVVRVSDMQKTV